MNTIDYKEINSLIYQSKEQYKNSSIPISVFHNNNIELTLFCLINSANFSVSLFHIATCKGNSRSIFISKSSYYIFYFFVI